MLPVMKYGSWEMAFRRKRMSWRGMVDRSMSSMSIVPELSSIMRKRVRIRELFPLLCVSLTFGNEWETYLPLRPQMPIFSLGWMDREMLSKDGVSTFLIGLDHPG